MSWPSTPTANGGSIFDDCLNIFAFDSRLDFDCRLVIDAAIIVEDRHPSDVITLFCLESRLIHENCKRCSIILYKYLKTLVNAL